MPKSKRAKVIHLTKVQKKGKDLSLKLFASIQQCLDEYQYLFVFSVANMRNIALKEVRSEFTDSRLFFGKTKVMAKALGSTAADEPAPNTHLLSNYLTGEVGLLFTSRDAQSVIAHFSSHSSTDYARAGNVATQGFAVPAGTVYSMGGRIAAEEDVPMGHSLEPELRKLGMPTVLVKGRITLADEYVVCEEGAVLDSRQTRLLKLFGVATAEFRVRLVAYWSAATHEVAEVENQGEMEE